MTSTYVTAFTDAQAARDGTAAPGYFAEQSLSLDPEINVTDGSYSGDWLALTTWGCDADTTLDMGVRSAKELQEVDDVGSVRKVRHRSGQESWQARWRDPSGKDRSKNFDRRVDASQYLVGLESDPTSSAGAIPTLVLAGPGSPDGSGNGRPHG